MTTQHTTIKFNTFVSREHYLSFRKAWKDYINAGNSKATWKEDSYGNKNKSSNLSGEYHLLFCILAGKDLAVTFKPSLNKSKNGFQSALHGLWYYVEVARKIVTFEETGETPKFVKDYDSYIERDKVNLNKFIEVFGITPKMLVNAFDGLRQYDFTNYYPKTQEAA